MFRRPVLQHRIVVSPGPEVGPLATALRHTAGLARSHFEVDGQSAADSIGAIHRPAAQEITEWPGRLVAPMPARAKRQFIAVAKNEIVQRKLQDPGI